jgi:tetratricopeptide (TPR) repeat protein
MRTGRKHIALATAAIAAAAALLGGVLAAEPPAQRSPAPRPAAAAQLLQGFSPGDTAAYVDELVARVEANPRDAEGLTLLGLVYQQRARETGDPSFYPRSEVALERALRLLPRNDLALTGLAALAASRHRFANSLALARRARSLNPASAIVYGIEGDALVELGRYRAAFAAVDRMAALKPSLAAYARVAYARELLGRPRAAIAAMSRAVEAGSATAENAAWTQVELGNLYFGVGKPVQAARRYRLALARFPGYHRALAALARAEAALGRHERAIALYRQALAAVPQPEYAAALGDVLTAAHQRADARKAYGLVRVMQRLLKANGVRTELETAVFDLDHGRDLAGAGALSRARQVYAERPSIDAADTLAWALYRNGRCRAALPFSNHALRLGTKDALKLFHRGMIERCLGRQQAARADLRLALAVNPYFSLRWGPVARRLVG